MHHTDSVRSCVDKLAL